ncbi:MAG TPA: hypothetical protein VGQ99_04075 [Tepidisphaeraceae bacterium]|nr:hypothetical protein [Tepidisphaeraceae bacterium]
MQGDSGDGGSVKRPPRRWGRWIGFALLGLIALVIVGHAFWGWWEEKKLGEEIAELRRKGEPMLAEDFKGNVVAEGENGADLLKEAAASIDPTSEVWVAFDRLELELRLTEAELKVVEGFVEENGEALRLVSQTREKKVDWGLAIKSPLLLVRHPESDELKRVAELVGAASLLADQKGKHAEAVQHVEDLLMISRMFGEMPGYVPFLMGIGVTAMGAERVIQIAPDLKIGTDGASEQQVKNLIAQLLDERALRESQWRALRWERAARVDAAREMIFVGGGKESVIGYVARPIVLGDGRLMLRHMQDFMGAAAGSDDWPSFQKASAKSMEMARQVRGSKLHLLASILMFSDEGIIDYGYRGLTDLRLAAVALAVRWYAVEHSGALPKGLDELVPKYLPGVPKDPFAGKGMALRYAFDEKRPVVYSVGKDGKDDGGSEKLLRRGIAQHARWVQEDVVAHLKRQERKTGAEVETEKQ